MCLSRYLLLHNPTIFPLLWDMLHTSIDLPLSLASTLLKYALNLIKCNSFEDLVNIALQAEHGRAQFEDSRKHSWYWVFFLRQQQCWFSKTELVGSQQHNCPSSIWSEERWSRFLPTLPGCLSQELQWAAKTPESKQWHQSLLQVQTARPHCDSLPSDSDLGRTSPSSKPEDGSSSR